eukprot:6197075-Pleurochrysis_carterae.AAC.1
MKVPACAESQMGVCDRVRAGRRRKLVALNLQNHAAREDEVSERGADGGDAKRGDKRASERRRRSACRYGRGGRSASP